MTVGAAHEHGMLALIDDAKRALALAEVREGRMYDLGHVLDEDVPVFPGRYFKQTLVTTAHHANPEGGVGENQVNWITELVSGTMQLGTHLDALSHLQMADRGYGGFTNDVSHWGYGTGWGDRPRPARRRRPAAAQGDRRARRCDLGQRAGHAAARSTSPRRRCSGARRRSRSTPSITPCTRSRPASRTS